MKTKNMTFIEALEAMKQGYKVRRKEWNPGSYIVLWGTYFKNENAENILDIPVPCTLSSDWEIYTEPKPEPQFETGELVMMRDDNDDYWEPKFFSQYAVLNDVDVYNAISDGTYEQCAKFDKDIVFTNKPAKQ